MTMAPVAPERVKTTRPKIGAAPKRSNRKLLAPREDWEEQALCAQVDPDLMTPSDRADGQTTPDPYNPAAAKKVCFGSGTGKFAQGCPVRRECGMRALENREAFGVWGGMCESEREMVLKQPKEKWPLLVSMTEEARKLELQLLQN